jgi:hypothetical protein
MSYTNIVYVYKIHGTYSRRDRIYREDIFYGCGKALQGKNEEGIKSEIQERESENPLVYRNNEMVYKITDRDLKKTS